ncbi:MAG: leucine--tRNA ligase, partial [Desulfurococcales archaeon]|nr:leucine--tRNA ligase [Desulfurococcales archaeon]
WEKEKVFEANPEAGRPKFFVTAAFMYPNGPIHIGHARTYVIPDILARYKRARGYNVLFPMGFHYTGTPILSMAEKIASGDTEYINKLAESFAVDANILKELTEPLKLARYFHSISKEAMKDYGLSIDWRREFTSIDPEFKSFIRWQFEKLREKGYIVKGSHPVGWCPKHEMPVGMHDTKDDVEPEISEMTIIKFKLEGSDVLIPVATLRPETVYGVTNLWINPNIEYCLCEMRSASRGSTEKWVIACEAYNKLKYQIDMKVLSKVDPLTLIDKYVVNPITGRRVKILEATFVDPKFGTGIVMSVPAHAPYDYAALRDYVKRYGEWPKELEPIPLIKVEGYGAIPAKDVVEKFNVVSQEDSDLLDKATKELYRVEYESGVMRADLAKLVSDAEITEYTTKYIAGRKVSEARERIREFMLGRGIAEVMYEILNAPVYCRCGTEIVVKILRNQWFIDYGNEKWKELSKKALARMRIVPEEARSQFQAVIDWLKAKACARTRGLGTELPWEKGWVIESLSDSTIYMAFYTVIHKIRMYGIDSSKLTKEFWDYVMLGEGDPAELSQKLGVPVNVLRELREEFNYWYPLDSRHSGKDLIPNHLTFFIFNHVAIFPEEKWPRQIVANGWVLIRGEKMSKSKGNIWTLKGLIEEFSPDATRLGFAIEAEVEQDLNFDYDRFKQLPERLREIEELVKELASSELADTYGVFERWLESRLASHVSKACSELDRVRVRAAGIRIFYLMFQDLKKYLSMVEKPSKVVRQYIETWIKMMAPYTPFFAEELWHAIGKKTLVVTEKWPEPEELKRHYDSELMVEYVEKLVEDMKELTKLVRGDRAVIYVAPREMYKLLFIAYDKIRSGAGIGEVIRALIKELPDIPKKDIPKLAKLLQDTISQLKPELIDVLRKINGIDELATMKLFRKYVEAKTGIKIVRVYESTDPSAPDYGGRKKSAIPWRPAIYIFSER